MEDRKTSPIRANASCTGCSGPQGIGKCIALNIIWYEEGITCRLAPDRAKFFFQWVRELRYPQTMSAMDSSV